MKFLLAAAALLCAGTANANCLLTKQKVDNLYNGAAMSSVEFHTGCEPELVSQNGYGQSAVMLFQIVDDRGSVLVITANGNERMTGYSLNLAR
jgi:hypothetical protein